MSSVSPFTLTFYSFGFEMAKDTAGCRALNRNYIVGGEFTKPILDKIEKVHYDLDIAIHDFNRAVENEYEMV